MLEQSPDFKAFRATQRWTSIRCRLANSFGAPKNSNLKYFQLPVSASANGLALGAILVRP